MIELFLEFDLSMLAPVMGIFGIGGSRSTREPDVLQLVPGVFGDQSPEVQALARRTQQFAGESGGRQLAPFNLPGRTGEFDFSQLQGASPTGSALLSELTSPQFGARNITEERILEGINKRFLGSTALQNLRPTGGGFAQSIAPTLAALRQQRIGNLSDAFKTEIGARLGGRAQDIGERGADIGAGVTARGQTIQGGQAQIDAVLNSFLSLLSLGRQTPVVRGGGGSATSFNIGFGKGK